MAKYLHLSHPLRRYGVGRVFRTRGASEEDGILRRAEKGRTGKSRQGKKRVEMKGKKKIWGKKKGSRRRTGWKGLNESFAQDTWQWWGATGGKKTSDSEKQR